MTATESDMSAGALPPGAEAYSDQLQVQLRDAWKERVPDYAPRTHHLQADGGPQFTNRLFLEASPYLLQHAHNPVNWYPWGDEAFETAKRLGRPVLLSVGYSTCHWCHVMEEESFEDAEIARYMNENYVAIKVDREERPDVDAIYMSAVQALTGGGGWPMTVWLTDDRKPFFGGTYFPARDGDRGAQHGFLTILNGLKRAYDQDPLRVAETAAGLTEHLSRAMTPPRGEGLPDATGLAAAAQQYQGRFDPSYGGLSGAPKFPSSLPVRFLFRESRRQKDGQLREMALLTLRRMASGGMYDQVGGGFHRYSTDSRWLVPHFEKMLYDNALLVVAYLEGFQVSGDEELADVARDILRYVSREMTAPEGAFYSATDADSLTPSGKREEGWFFTWTPGELEDVLGDESAKIVGEYYAVRKGGNFEGRSILHRPRPLSAVASVLDLSEERVLAVVHEAREPLYQRRAERPPPLRDDKVLVAWNGLMISAFAQAALILGDRSYVEPAVRAAEFILGSMRRQSRLLRSSMRGTARHNAYLDDYAFLTAGLLDLFEATGDALWLEESIALDQVLEAHYEDEAGGFFMTSDDHEALLVREKPSYDGAEPCGNSVALMNLLRLHEFTTDDRYRQRAERALGAFGQMLARAPVALSEMLLALDFLLDKPREIVIVTPGDDPFEEARPMLDRLAKTFFPSKVVAVVQEGPALERLAKSAPIARGKLVQDGKPTAYICQAGRCQLPATDPEVFWDQLKGDLPSGTP